jgi:hypothetical protein
MLTPDQVKQRVAQILGFPVQHRHRNTFFPLVLAGSGHSRIDDFGEVRSAIAVLRQQSKEGVRFGYEIEWQERSFRRFAQKLPRFTFSSRDTSPNSLGKSVKPRNLSRITTSSKV